VKAFFVGICIKNNNKQLTVAAWVAMGTPVGLDDCM